MLEYWLCKFLRLNYLQQSTSRPMPTSIKKQAENAQTPLVVWLCSFNTVLTIMLHFGIKNT